MVVLSGFRVSPQPKSPATRDVNLLWGISVPTTSIDNFAAGTNVDMIYGATLAHEVGHVLGLRHRIAGADPFADGLTTPKTKNLMFPQLNVSTAEDLDIVQAKTVRLSEVLARNP